MWRHHSWLMCFGNLRSQKKGRLMKTSQGSNIVADESRISPAIVKENRSRSTLICKNQQTVVDRCARWVMPFFLFIFLALRPLALMAQTLPYMFIDDARVFEGNSGTTTLQLPVHFIGSQPNAAHWFDFCDFFVGNRLQPGHWRK